MRWLDSINDSMDMNVSKLQETVNNRSLACGSPWGHQGSDTPEQLTLSLSGLKRAPLALLSGSWRRLSSPRRSVGTKTGTAHRS